jgi:hypothetical protein
MQTKSLCIISENFGIQKLLIRFSAFFRYKIKKWGCNGTVPQVFIDLKEDHDSVEYFAVFSLSMVQPSN